MKRPAVLVLLAFAVFAACGGPGAMTPFEMPTLGFRVSYPQRWTAEDNGDRVGFFSESRDAGVMFGEFYNAPREEAIATIFENVTGPYQIRFGIGDNLLTETQRSLSMEDAARIGVQEGYSGEFEGSYNDVDCFFRIFIFRNGEQVYQMMCYSSLSARSQSQAVFDAMLNTLTLTGASE